MGWLISIAMLIVGLIYENDVMLIASGLFGIAGAIAFASVTLKNNKKTDKE